jgi:hypothetical protein
MKEFPDYYERLEWMESESRAGLGRQAPVTTRVTADHRATLERIFSHPTGANIEWRQVLSLREAVSSVTEERNGNVKVTLGGETEVLRPPREKDVDKQTIGDLRRMLSSAGLAPCVLESLGGGDFDPDDPTARYGPPTPSRPPR